MGFWIFMLIMDVMIPLMMIAFGRLFLKHPPKEINAVFGYRTSRSMKNKDTWEFAHRYCGKLWFRCGLVLLPLSAAGLLPAMGKEEGATGIAGSIVCTVQILVLIGSIYPVEKALKKKFGQ